jgi:hypothetical protein
MALHEVIVVIKIMKAQGKAFYTIVYRVVKSQRWGRKLGRYY